MKKRSVKKEVQMFKVGDIASENRIGAPKKFVEEDMRECAVLSDEDNVELINTAYGEYLNKGETYVRSGNMIVLVEDGDFGSPVVYLLEVKREWYTKR